MIRKLTNGDIYICVKDSKNYNPYSFTKFDGEIQIDTDCLSRDRFVGYSKNSFRPLVDSHRINLAKNPGEIFEQPNYYSFWLPKDIMV